MNDNKTTVIVERNSRTLEINMVADFFRDKEVGDKIPYEKVMDMLGIADRQEPIFGYIVGKARQRVYTEDNMVIDCLRNFGYLVCDPAMRIKKSESLVSSGIKKVRSGCTMAERTDPKQLTTEQKKVRDKMRMMQGRFALADRRNNKDDD